MAESRRYALHPQLDIQQILLEAQTRWLRPSEVCEILRNYQKFCLTPDPPFKPPGGSLFLFDRKALRYFRKDGHRWRKKKDGKTVREAHEKLKSGSVDVLHCYYAHGEDNENFQRRSYWLLDGQLEHIVLVHYREVKEGNKSAIPHMLNVDPGPHNHTESAQTSLTPFSSQGSHVVAAQVSNASSGSTADWNGQSPSSEFEDGDSVEDFGASSFAEPISGSRFQIDSIHGSERTDKNTFVYSGSISHPYPRGLRDAAETNDGSCNPFNANQGVPQNLISSLGHQSVYGSSEEDGLYGRSSFNHDVSPATWSEILSSNRSIASIYDQKSFSDRGNGAELKARKVADAIMDDPNIVKNELDAGSNVSSNARLQKFMWSSAQEHLKMENVEHPGSFPGDKYTGNDVAYLYPEAHEQTLDTMAQFKTNRDLGINLATVDQSLGFETEDSQTLKDALESSLYNDEQVGLKKLDSFGRWMNKEIGKDCDDPLMASDSSNIWSTLDTQNTEKEVSSLSRQMQLDVDSPGPSLSQDQLFSIVDLSPDWGYSGVETKVLIVGTFLGGIKHPSSNKWCCMFGEVEVSAEILPNNALRCQVPAHSPGRVPFYITRNNRLACSEVREFEYRKKPPDFSFSIAVKREMGDERQLQIRLAKMLFQGVEKIWLDCSDENCDKCRLKKSKLSMQNDENEWDMIEKASKALEGNQEKCNELLIQKLLKDRLYEWLVCKLHEEGRGPNVLDEGGQGVTHLAAALGYEWAMSPIVAAGVSPSFRDARGRTGLHWAAYYGREETVVELVRLGAAPGALEDPTSQFPQGRTAADLASIIGHKGIAGYLAEADLTSHLSSLKIKESVTESVFVEKSSIESEEDQNIVPLAGGREELVSLKGSLAASLAAVRNSAQAAARIQAAFRLNSFRQRQLTRNNDEESEIPSELIVLASRTSQNQKIGHFSDSLHSAAALRIQQKYRGWKGRKEFLKIRNRIVKIQAHVRGHQVRKQYKKVIWSVSIVEKLILRWRRKKTGLRGFRADNAIGSVEPVVEKTDEYEFLSLGRKQKGAGVEKALARVQSMVRYPEARDQYMRMVTNSQKSKMGDEKNTSSQFQSTKEGKTDEDQRAFMTY